jgi:RNA polymerase sigma-70 factor (ECF subfamily)
MASLAASSDPRSPGYVGRLRLLPAGANRSPAAAAYLRRPGDREYLPFAIGVLRVAGGRIEEITAFHDPGLFPAFGLPAALPPADR